MRKEFEELDDGYRKEITIDDNGNVYMVRFYKNGKLSSKDNNPSVIKYGGGGIVVVVGDS